MTNSTRTKFSTSIIAITGLISAIGGIITVLYTVGVLGMEKAHDKEEKTPELLVTETKPIEKRDVQTKEIKIVTPPKPTIVKKVIKAVNLTGYWVDTNTPNGKYYINHESSGNISFTEYSLMFGSWVTTATGSGKKNGNTLEIPYITYAGTNGNFKGKLVSNGKKIQGTAYDFSAGIQVALNLQKLN